MAVKRDGKWRSDTTIKLDEKFRPCTGPAVWELDIRTYKLDAQLFTVASVGKRDGNFVTHRMYTDFNQVLSRSYPARCTAAVVDAQHNAVDEALIIQRVQGFYAAKASQETTSPTPPASADLEIQTAAHPAS